MKKFNNFNKFVISFLFALCFTQSATADIENEMGQMFGSMVNVTPSMTNINGVQRGVIAGPGIAVKNKITNINLVSFVPPSFEAGCGGIDFFGGSFSFISAEQFQQLLRNIAANAVGYAFKLALGSMCPECAQELADLQDTLEKWNRMLGDSCQAAEYLVDSTIGPSIQSASRNLGTKLSNVLGLGNEFDMTTGTNAANPVTTAYAADAFKDCTFGSNILWCSMKKGGVKSWFDSDDNETLEIAMSLVGTLVVGDPVSDDATASGQSPDIITFEGILSLKDFVDGGTNIQLIRCDESVKCLNPIESTENIKGMKQRITDVLLGVDGVNEGAIAKFSTNSGALTTQELNLLGNLPYGLGPMIRNLAIKSQSLAALFVKEAAPHIAYGMADVMIEDMMDATLRSLHTHDSEFVGDLIKVIERSRLRLNTQSQKLQLTVGPVTELIQYYSTLMTTIKSYRNYGKEIIGAGINSSPVMDR